MGVTPRKVPQKANRLAAERPRGKGERVRQELTGLAVTSVARQTPSEARRNREALRAVPPKSPGSVARGRWRHRSQKNDHDPRLGDERGLQNSAYEPSNHGASLLRGAALF